jgi:hypothetical protein
VRVEAFLADAVQAVGGKLSALGVGWTTLSAQRFPARHDRVALGVIVRIPPEEARTGHRLSVTLLGPGGAGRPLGRRPDGNPLTEFDAPFQVPSGDAEATATFALNFDGLVFDAPGGYTFVLAVDGQEQGRLPFRVQTPPATPAAEHRAGGYL